MRPEQRIVPKLAAKAIIVYWSHWFQQMRLIFVVIHKLFRFVLPQQSKSQSGQWIDAQILNKFTDYSRLFCSVRPS